MWSSDSGFIRERGHSRAVKRGIWASNLQVTLKVELAPVYILAEWCSGLVFIACGVITRTLFEFYETLAARDEAFNMLMTVVIKRARREEENSERGEARRDVWLKNRVVDVSPISFGKRESYRVIVLLGGQ